MKVPFKFGVLVVLLVSGAGRAQVYTASLTGVVTDPTGAVVPNAKVTLTDEAKGFSFAATTDTAGQYIVRDLPPSTYRLSVESQGFKTYTRSGITLDVKQTGTADVTLELGTSTQTVQV